MQRLDLEKWQHLADDGARRLEGLLAGGGGSVVGIAAGVRQRLADHRANNSVSLAFVGQYSAGKSTMISALTARDDIPIAAGITTDRCTAYEWRGIRLVDTPGLYTERDEHDEIATDEIERSDLLAFCLTIHLFDPITLGNFRELAATHRYAPKMLLVVNKLFAEAGDVDARVERYRDNLEEMLGPALVRSMPIVFVDAQLYRDGVRRGNAKLSAKSRFDDLIAALNKLTDERGLLGMADTPFRIVLGGVNDAIEALAGGGDSDKGFLHLWRRLMDIFLARRTEVHRAFRDAANDAAEAVLDEGNSLMETVDFEGLRRFEAAEQLCHQRLGEKLDKIRRSLQRTILAVGDRLQRDVEDVRSLPLFEAFARKIKTNVDVDPAGAGPFSGAPRAQSQLAMLQNLAAGLDGLLSRPGRKGLHVSLPRADTLALGGAAMSAFPPMMETAQGVVPLATTSFDDVIRGTVDHLNTQFDWHLTPDAAIGASHHLNQFLHAIGPALALGSVAVSIYQMHEERKANEKLGELRLQLRDKYDEVRKDAKAKFEAYGTAFEADVLQRLEKDMHAKRDAAEKEISSGNELVAALRALRNDLEASLSELAASAL